MGDETSDADKIRMKRMAKLGLIPNQQNGGSPSASPAPNGSPSTSDSAPASNDTPKEPEPPKSPSASSKGSSLLRDNSAGGEKKKEKAPVKINVRPANNAPKREANGAERPRPAEKPQESFEDWQHRVLSNILRATLNPEQTQDAHNYKLVYLQSIREDLEEQNAPLKLSVTAMDTAIPEAAGLEPGRKPFEYLLACFKRCSRHLRSAKGDEKKVEMLKEARRLCMSYCIFSVTMSEMYGEDRVHTTNPLVEHMLKEPESDLGIDTDFLNEAVAQFDDEDTTIKETVINSTEQLCAQLAAKSMLDDYQSYVLALRNLVRYPKIVEALTQSPSWLPDGIEAQNVETATILGPFFRLSPMQTDVAVNYFSVPRSRDKAYISNAQNALRMSLRTHQLDLFTITDAFIKAGPAPRGRMLDWMAACVNKNHKRRAMRVDYKTVSSDGFMVNLTNTLDQLCDPFMDATFSKIEKIDFEYLRRSPRVDISDETKINVDQAASDEFYSQKAGGTSNFISEVFFLTVAAHHYGTESAQTRMQTLRKTVKRMEKDEVAVETERHKYINDPRYLARFEEHVKRLKKTIDDNWSTIHAITGVLLDDLNQARSMQFMRYVIVWILRLASKQDLPRQKLQLPLPEEQPDMIKYLPEYFLEDIVDNFKFITSHMPWIITGPQCEEIMQVCITFLRCTEYVKNPGVKSGLVTILFYGVQPFYNQSRGVLGDLLNGSEFAHKHLLHALMRFYIEAESTGTHTQFYDKFNIRYEIFMVIKCIWPNTMYRDNLAKEARVNTDFFVQFVNMLVNDATFVLDEALSSFVKIHDLTKELSDANRMPGSLREEERKEKQENLDQTKSQAKSYMGLARESMETLILFTEALADAFTMPEIVTRLADMLDYNLDIMVGPRSSNLKVENPSDYGFDPKMLLCDIMKVYQNLSTKQSFATAIARDGRSYRPANFEAAKTIMKRFSLKSPDELRIWSELSSNVAATKAAEEQEEEDLGEVPDEFLDPLLSDLMRDPVILPRSRNTVDRSTIRSHLLSDPTDPFNRTPLRIEDVLPDVEMKARIDEWIAGRKAAKRGGEGEEMDTSAG
ncbi:hypothetical protein MBLNU230_g1519t1 [Neophaeotheca triangularis]